MLTTADAIGPVVDDWFADFERALAEPDDALLGSSLHRDSHWRDVLALSWRIQTVNGSDAILKALRASVGRHKPTGFRTDPGRTPPRRVTRAGTAAIEAIVDTLIVDRGQRIGDNWRHRYHALTLHNQVHVNHLPYMPFPPNWPTYIPKDEIANWFKAYRKGSSKRDPEAAPQGQDRWLWGCFGLHRRWRP